MPSKAYIHFELSERRTLLRVFDIVSVLVGLYIVSTVFTFDYFKINGSNWLWTVILVVYLVLFANIFELYNLQKSSKFELIFPNVLIVSAVTVIMYLLTPFLTPVLPDNRLQIVYFFFAITFSLLIWRWSYIFFVSSPLFHKNYIIIGTPDEISLMYDVITESSNGFKIIGYYNLDPGKKLPGNFPGIKPIKNPDLIETVRGNGVSEIIIANKGKEDFSRKMFADLIQLLESGIPIREYAQVYEEFTCRVPIQYIENEFYKYIPFSRSNQNKLYLFVHRLIDILVAILGISFCLLTIPFILIGNRIANKGPLFYVQQRVGKNGFPFTIYKFRTMVVNAEKDGAKWASKNDYRITRFGSFLRKSRLDEMPQFFNILKGNMSVIGPRPERPEFVAELSKELPFYETRHVIKPGLTGWAQVSYAYGSSKKDSLKKLQYDLYYIKHRSFFLDARIIIKTLSTILFYRGQ
ncbi:exopolysaccharide biosynthesis polyprenyl glycosylphosphotransferase [Leptobacterium flavescens]|uniref:Exopolysaccharide biosynthesis polyprenyl glycosylphosphotransferase n=1 Tax=Leptobacterium flavescens TaxID=472055 RepID=A0A6P0UFV6_9FLAO|nr:sugar transferase [Leptobacterium flavescens]NER12161.1 exopolysaccharide biosynthesis polyprenyl glycosylphosphotransferase [Leptobacterium flavescens]